MENDFDYEDFEYAKKEMYIRYGSDYCNCDDTSPCTCDNE